MDIVTLLKMWFWFWWSLWNDPNVQDGKGDFEWILIVNKDIAKQTQFKKLIINYFSTIKNVENNSIPLKLFYEIKHFLAVFVSGEKYLQEIFYT